MEHRYTVDGVTDPRLVRISVGVEELEVSRCFVFCSFLTEFLQDLKNDIRLGFQKVIKV